MSDPKITAAFPVLHTIDGNWVRDPRVEYLGLSQYAYIAATFHAARLMHQGSLADLTSSFRQADDFFAELAKRTAP